MTYVTGYITLTCFVLLAAKYPLRKLGAHRTNAFLMRLHEAASAVFMLAGLLHMILVLKLLGSCTVWLPVSGFAAFAVSLVLIAACHMTKDAKKKMYWHRRYSLAMFAAIAVHLILQIQ